MSFSLRRLWPLILIKIRIIGCMDGIDPKVDALPLFSLLFLPPSLPSFIHSSIHPHNDRISVDSSTLNYPPGSEKEAAVYVAGYRRCISKEKLSSKSKELFLRQSQMIDLVHKCCFLRQHSSSIQGVSHLRPLLCQYIMAPVQLVLAQLCPASICTGREWEK